MITSVETKKAALVDGLEGRKSLELITALYESIETDTDVHGSNRRSAVSIAS